MNCVGLTTFATSAAHWSPGQGPPPPTGTVVRPCRPGHRLPETAIAFAGEKLAVLAQFSGVEVMVVSMVAVQGSAVVLSVSKSPRCRASCAKKFALRGLMVDVSAKKFALHA